VVEEAEGEATVGGEVGGEGEGGGPVGGVVAVVGVDVVEVGFPQRVGVVVGDAGGDDFEEGEAASGAGVADGGDGEAVELVGSAGETAGDEGGFGDGEAEEDGVETVGAFFGGGVLSFGEAVGAVVHDDVGEGGVAAEGVDEVAHADRVAVAVAAGGDDGEFGVGEGGTGGGGEDPAVEGVVAVGAEVVLDGSRAADPGQDEDLVGWDAELGDGLADGGLDAEVAAAGAPDGEGGTVGVGHAVSSRMRAASSPGRCGIPS
jgi:hypothetical protein